MTMQRPGAPDGAKLDPRFDAAWSDHRRHLLDVAYRLLGSVSEAEDMVQEGFAQLLQADLDGIDDTRGWLTTVVSRRCLDQLRSARVRHEAYVGPRFPEPVIEPSDALMDPAERITIDESVRMALLIVLERLSPAERVAFVLHDIFQFSFEEVGRIVERTPAACRQLASRARRQVQGETGPARFEIEPAEQMRVAERFVAAISGGELKPLLKMLDPNVAGWADTGGLAAAFVEPLVGRDEVGERLLRFMHGSTVFAMSVNGEAGVVAVRDGQVRVVVVLTIRDGLILRMDAIADPSKLVHVNAILKRRLH
jgi:RNA polymerase sigma-70 factor (ECF subfamily)